MVPCSMVVDRFINEILVVIPVPDTHVYHECQAGTSRTVWSRSRHAILDVVTVHARYFKTVDHLPMYLVRCE